VPPLWRAGAAADSWLRCLPWFSQGRTWSRWRRRGPGRRARSRCPSCRSCSATARLSSLSSLACSRQRGRFLFSVNY
jgi:hypothetical protein